MTFPHNVVETFEFKNGFDTAGVHKRLSGYDLYTVLYIYIYIHIHIYINEREKNICMYIYYRSHRSLLTMNPKFQEAGFITVWDGDATSQPGLWTEKNMY